MNTIDLNQNLSPHFRLNEFVASGTAIRHNIDNTPREEHVERLKALCENVLEASEATLRSDKDNKRIPMRGAEQEGRRRRRLATPARRGRRHQRVRKERGNEDV